MREALKIYRHAAIVECNNSSVIDKQNEALCGGEYISSMGDCITRVMNILDDIEQILEGNKDSYNIMVEEMEFITVDLIKIQAINATIGNSLLVSLTASMLVVMKQIDDNNSWLYSHRAAMKDIEQIAKRSETNE